MPKPLRYMDFLKMKQSILEDIYNNSVEQSDALERKDYALLEKLLKARQNDIEKFGQIREYLKEYHSVEKNEETEKLEQSIRFLVQEVININGTNTNEAVNQKNDIAEMLRNIKLGKCAIRNGYYKKIPQRYGYFIDKKIGKYI